jgi:DNA gyrase subunit B
VTNETLTPVEAVRKRPGMYVGGLEDGSGIQHMLLEVVANSIDQYFAGRCTRIAITVAADGTITVEDDGPGLTVEGEDGRPPLDILLSRRSETPTVDGHRPHVHLGLGGIGLFVVNALSEWFELRSVRSGIEVTTSYERGCVVEPAAKTSSERGNGTTVCFRPDREIFAHPRMPRAELAWQLENLSFLAPRLSLTWTIEGDETARGGIAARVALCVPCALEEVASHNASYATPTGPIDVSVALAWGQADDISIESFVNLGRTRDHGHHVDGLLAGVRSYFGGRQEVRNKGLVASVAIVLADVTYGEPTASRAVAPQAMPVVAEATVAALHAWEARQPDRANAIRDRVARSRRTRSRSS